MEMNENRIINLTSEGTNATNRNSSVSNFSNGRMIDDINKKVMIKDNCAYGLNCVPDHIYLPMLRRKDGQLTAEDCTLFPNELRVDMKRKDGEIRKLIGENNALRNQLARNESEMKIMKENFENTNQKLQEMADMLKRYEEKIDNLETDRSSLFWAN